MTVLRLLKKRLPGGPVPRALGHVPHQNPKYIYTEQYPAERPPVAERYRGAPRLNINPENGETLCISCNLCALACPENLIVVTSERNETRRKELTISPTIRRAACSAACARTPARWMRWS